MSEPGRPAGPGGGKITAGHRSRDAVIYVRQSTFTQTQENTESLALQYELRAHAAELGWAEHQISVIDEDLARSAASTSGRLGFTDLVAAVGLGRVGIIIGREVSRLARNNSDWYQVLDLCSITDTLIADCDGVYHPGQFNDRLVLGLKGQMAEAELHMLRTRLTAALRHKAARGELRQHLPVGLDYDDDGQVILSPDEAVRAAISQVYALFGQLTSARQVMMTLRARGLLLPRRKPGARRIWWAEASYPAVHDMLTNPAYAGAFVFGRTRTEKHVGADGKVACRERLLPQDQWEVLIPGHHPGYLSWDTWQDNQARLRATTRPRAATAAEPPARAPRCCPGWSAAASAAGRCRSAIPVTAATRRGMCAAAAPSCMAPRRARASAGLTCTAPSWGSYSRCCSQPRCKPPRTRWPTPSSGTASRSPRSGKPWSGPGSRPTARCASTTRSSRATGWSPAPWRHGWRSAWPPCSAPKPASPPPAPATPST